MPSKHPVAGSNPAPRSNAKLRQASKPGVASTTPRRTTTPIQAITARALGNPTKVVHRSPYRSSGFESLRACAEAQPNN